MADIRYTLGASRSAVAKARVSEKVVRQAVRSTLTRKQLFEALVYELKPFVLSVFGGVLAIYFTRQGISLGRFAASTIFFCGLYIFYSRAKARGMMN